MRPTNNEEILNEINKPKNIDLRVSLVKYVKQEKNGSLVIIFSKSFRDVGFPKILKIRKVIPIYAKGMIQQILIIRPISLLDICRISVGGCNLERGSVYA